MTISRLFSFVLLFPASILLNCSWNVFAPDMVMGILWWISFILLGFYWGKILELFNIEVE